MENSHISFQSDLASDEQIHWTGRPRQGVILKPSDALIIPFSIMWAGFSFFWEYFVFQQYQAGKPVLFMVFWGVPFGLIAVYILILRFFFDAYLRSKTVYAVTSRRVLIKSSAFQNRLVSIELKNLPPLNITTTTSNLTTIEFGPKTYSGRSRTLPPSFEQIVDGKKVLALLRS